MQSTTKNLRLWGQRIEDRKQSGLTIKDWLLLTGSFVQLLPLLPVHDLPIIMTMNKK